MRVIVCKFMVILVIFGCIPCFADVKTLDEVGGRLRRCEEKWCVSVARPPSPWPSHLKAKTIPVEEHPAVTLDIPAGFNRIRSVDYLLMFIYEGNKVLILEEVTKDAFPELREYTSDSRMTMAEAGHATFTKTTKDKAPDCLADAKFWQWSMFFKMAFFEDNSPVYTSRNESLTAYYLSKKREGGALVNEAVIINDNSPDYLLKLKSANMSFEEFKSIIGSIKEKKATRP
ncbi:hypothetical protein ANAEL_04009 [Anaerolineales bacterium]|nr:hypothetical protein ANAEL_04009 [Anaerolineales bacterium]